MNVSETLVSNWILAEAAANEIVEWTPGGYIFRGNQHDFIIEVKAFKTDKD